MNSNIDRIVDQTGRTLSKLNPDKQLRKVAHNVSQSWSNIKWAGQQLVGAMTSSWSDDCIRWKNGSYNAVARMGIKALGVSAALAVGGIMALGCASVEKQIFQQEEVGLITNGGNHAIGLAAGVTAGIAAAPILYQPITGMLLERSNPVLRAGGTGMKALGESVSSALGWIKGSDKANASTLRRLAGSHYSYAAAAGIATLGTWIWNSGRYNSDFFTNTKAWGNFVGRENNANSSRLGLVNGIDEIVAAYDRSSQAGNLRPKLSNI